MTHAIIETREQDRRISEVLEREYARLRGFIAKRVPDPLDIEDVLQDVLYEFVLASRLIKPVERAGAWLFRVAQNRITDLFRKKKPEPLNEGDVLRSKEPGPDAAYAQTLLVDELNDALAHLPADQREVFIAHEMEGRSFQDIAHATGVNINTLLSRKHAAVLALRRRLRDLYDHLDN